MKSVGIITFYLTHNHGTMLQCYALKTVIEDISGYTVNIIPHTYFSTIGNGFGEPYLYEMYDKSIAMFDQFLRKELNCTSEHIPKLTAENAPKYDYYVAGSDAIWNTGLIESDGAFFLDFAESLNAVKIAYAPSLSCDNPDALNCDLFEKYIDKFDYLSVREATDVNFLKRYTHKEIYNVLDPTYLLDSQQYLKLIDRKRRKEKGFILLYMIYEETENIQKIINYANRISLERDLDVVHFVYNIPNYVFGERGKTFAFDGPKDFLWYFSNADMILTNSFHGVAFSIIFRKPFYVRLRPGARSKIGNILHELGLEDRILMNEFDINKLEFELDYSNAEVNLRKMINESYRYLKMALDLI